MRLNGIFEGFGEAVRDFALIDNADLLESIERELAAHERAEAEAARFAAQARIDAQTDGDFARRESELAQAEADAIARRYNQERMDWLAYEAATS